jgi:hypothetical protein
MKGVIPMKLAVWALLLAVVVGVTGCGGSNEDAAQNRPTSPKPQVAGAQDQGPGETAPQPPEVNTATPEAAAEAFFTALRVGDVDLVRFLLTKKAQEESDKQGVAIDPPGNPSASFVVGEVEHFQDATAYVHGSWTEPASDGTQTLNIVWILRKEASGWRIAGLVAQSGSQQAEYNFEDPVEMHHRRVEAEQRQQVADSGSHTPAADRRAADPASSNVQR